MSGHTEGQWRAEAWSCHAATTVLVDDDSLVTGKRIVAECETEEDARLIAAAPELLEALILLEHEMVESGNARSVDYGWKPAIAKTRAAIAAATGESHE